MNLTFRAILLAVLATLIVSGCNPQRDRLAEFDGLIASVKYDQSLDFSQKYIKDKPTPARNDLLWTLQAAAVQRLIKDHQASTASFDRSEDMIKYFDEQAKLGDSAKSTVVNENAIPYRGYSYDAIMVNTYKALSFMASGDNEYARIEFNRLLDRQRRAKIEYNKEIQKLKEELQEKKSKGGLEEKNANNPEIDKLISQKYPSLTQFEAYPDFVNPFSTYMAGLFFTLVGDSEKGRDLLKETKGMVPDNDYITADFVAADKTAASQSKISGNVWVIFENGMGPVKEEFRIDIPLFVATEKILYTGIALPKLKFRNQAWTHLDVVSNDKIYQSSVIASMDRVIQTEFDKSFKMTLTRAIIATTAKAVAQYAIQKQNNSSSSFLTILMAAYTAATTTADVRIWTMLPKDFQVAAAPLPENGKILVKSPQGQTYAIDIEPCDNAIVYIKVLYNNQHPVYDVITFK